jgi:hypothetical protein
MSTPSDRVIAAAQQVLETRDVRGRKLTIKRLDALDKLRLFKAAGPELAQNEPYLGMAVLAYSVTAIDDVPIPPPVNEGQIEQAVQRLGEEGLAAVVEVLAKEDDRESRENSAGATRSVIESAKN